MITNDDRPADLLIPHSKRRPGAFLKLIFLFVTAAVLATVVLYITYLYLQTPPRDFPINVEVNIPAGSSVREITELFKEFKVTRSKWVLYYIIATKFDPTNLKAGTYVFDKKLRVEGVAEVLSKGTAERDLVRFTHVDGERVTLLAKRAAAALPNFDEAEFLNLALAEEGRLFPDTYFVPIRFTASDMYTLITENFSDKLAPLADAIAESELSLDEIINLASILEREANSVVSMKMVSGILRNRLRIGMALQADATIEYILDKPLSELTANDLRELDSPYNTYLYNGLPPTPIGNPGLQAIEAVLYPTLSNNLFYITGNDGNFYYATNFDDHRRNIARYLR